MKIFVFASCMMKKSRQLVDGLRSVLVEVQRLIDLADDEQQPISVPADIAKQVQERLEAGICLQAKDDHPAKPPRRGLCHKHFNASMNRIKKGKVTMRQLIERGLITPEPQRSGRKEINDSLLDELIEEISDNKVADLQAAAKAADNSRPGKKKGAKKS